MGRRRRVHVRGPLARRRSAYGGRVLRVFVEDVRCPGVLRDAVHDLAGHLQPGGQTRRERSREIYGHFRRVRRPAAILLCFMRPLTT